METHNYTYKYPRPAVTTDCVVFGFDGHDLKILLIERGLDPYKGCWAFPGGFLNMDETAEQGAMRELKEETGLDLHYLKQVGAFSEVDRDPRDRVITIAFYALAKKADVQGGDDAAKAQWFAINEMPRLAFDHDCIFRKAMQKLRIDIHFEPIGFGLLDEKFTMPELQRLYEAILGIQFDRRNFYKKMLQTGILDKAKDDETELATDFGEHKEMKSEDTETSFGGFASETCPPYSTRSDDDSRRRKGTHFSFNKQRYDKFKEDNNFRLEF